MGCLGKVFHKMPSGFAKVVLENANQIVSPRGFILNALPVLMLAPGFPWVFAGFSLPWGSQVGPQVGLRLWRRLGGLLERS